MKFSPQQQRVYDYLKANPGSTIREMHRHIYPGVDKVSARLSEIQDKGVVVHKERNKYHEMMYTLGRVKKKQYSYVFDPIRGCMVEEVTEVEV